MAESDSSAPVLSSGAPVVAPPGSGSLDYAELIARLEVSETARLRAETARQHAEASAREAATARQHAEARTAAAEARVAEGGGGRAPPPPAVGGATTRNPLRFAARTELLSPTSANAKNFLEDPFCAFVTAPVSLVASATLSAAFDRLMATASSTGHATSRSIVLEEPFYSLVTATLPPGTEHAQQCAAARTLFGDPALSTRAWAFAARAKPELKVRSSVPRTPGFGGELKSAATKTALEQAAYYTAMDMIRSYFPDDDDDDVRPRRFYGTPPLGFAIVGFPYVAHLISFEWIGKLIVAPYSQPFIVGSAEHVAAVAALPCAPCAEPTLLDASSLEWRLPAEDAPQRDRVCWAVDGSLFRKLVRGDDRTAAEFASMFRVYGRLRGLLRDDATRPPALVPHVQLLFGAHEVMVEMTAVVGDDCSMEEVTSPGDVLTEIASTIAWLARRCIVYADLRGPNVRKRAADGAVFLVDFDDCVVTDAPVADVEAYAEALAVIAGAAAGGGRTFAGELCGGRLPEVTKALALAFSR